MFVWLEDMWSTIAALLASAFAGVIAERFLNIFGRVLRPLWYWTFGWMYRWNRRRRESQFAVTEETFAIGAAKHHIYVRQFAIEGFEAQNLRTITEPQMPVQDLMASIPSRLRDALGQGLEVAIQQKRRDLDAAPDAWNAEKLALRRLHVSRVGTHEAPELTLGFGRSDYATFQVVASRWESWIAQGHMVDLRSENLMDVLPALSHSFGINLTIETADNQLLLTRRSAKTQGAKRLRHISVNEGMSVDDVDPQTRLPDPYKTAIRGIGEELGIDVSGIAGIRNKITFHSLICDVTRYEWALLGHVNLAQTELSNGAFRNARKLGMGADDWEASELQFIPLSKAALTEALHDDRDWVGHGYVNLLLSGLFRLRADRAALLKVARAAIESRRR